MKFWKIANKTVDLFRTRKSDFIMVGGTRSGSTTLHYLLNQHPQIFMSRRQELQYFNRDQRFRENLSGYTEHFSRAPRGCITGETTPMYMHKGYIYDTQDVLQTNCDDDAITRIARLLPDARLIISLRNPIDRMVSEYKKNRNQGKFDKTLAQLLEEEAAGAPGFGPLYSNRYDIHLEHIFAYFPREQVHVMIFEEWTKNLPDSLTDLHHFLGVHPSTDVILPDQRKANSAQKYHKTSGAALVKSGDADLTKAQLCILQKQLAPAFAYVDALLGRPVPWENSTHI